MDNFVGSGRRLWQKGVWGWIVCCVVRIWVSEKYAIGVGTHRVVDKESWRFLCRWVDGFCEKGRKELVRCGSRDLLG